MAISSQKRHLSKAQQALLKVTCSQEITIPEMDTQGGGAFNDLALHILCDPSLGQNSEER